ncbi:hypothetical protein AMTRI_Chr13g86830 [Amborella trichopoda]
MTLLNANTITYLKWHMLCAFRPIFSLNFGVNEYNANVEFFWAPFLVDLEEVVLGQPKRVLKPSEFGGNAQAWRGVDILIFKSSHYWRDQINGLYDDLDRIFIYKRPNGNWCVNETELIAHGTFLSPIPPQMTIIETVLREKIFKRMLTSGDGEMRYDTGCPADCNHWCVSGVPDIWNELLEFPLLFLVFCESLSLSLW